MTRNKIKKKINLKNIKKKQIAIKRMITKTDTNKN